MRLLFIVCTLSLLRRLRRWLSATAAKGGHDPRRRDCAKFWYNTGSTASAFCAAGRHPRRAALFVVCSVMGAARPSVQLFRHRRGRALLLCQFLVQSICRPQRLPVVVDAIQRVLTAFLRRVCNWVDKLAAERFSGDCGAILTPYACARFLAPTAAKVARACKPCAWIWFCPGGGSIKNTPPPHKLQKNRPRYPPYPLQRF